MTPLRGKPAAIETLNLNLDTAGLTLGPFDVFLEVLLGYTANDAR